MSPSRGLTEALGAILRLLERRRIPHMVMGGLALSVWGRVRMTQDVDVSLSLGVSQERALLDALQEAQFLPDAPRAIRGHRLIVCRYLKSTKGFPVQVDLLLAREPYHQQAIQRAVEMTVGRQRLRVIAPEDLILYKLLADRPIDRLDVQSILEEQTGRLDMAYLTRWARRLGISKRLRALTKNR